MSAAAIVLIALALGAGVTAAAARFDHATPGPEQVVNTAPARVNIYTVRTTTPNLNGTQAIVLDHNQAEVDLGDTAVDPNDHHHFSVGLKPNLPPGRYIVSFKTMGEADYDLDGGNYAFYIGQRPSPADLAADKSLSLTTLDDPSDFTGYQRGVIEGGLTAVLLLPVGYMVYRRKGRTEDDELEARLREEEGR